MTWRIVAVNPGSTSTKVALFEGDECIVREDIFHQFSGAMELWKQLPIRWEVLRRFLEEECDQDVDAVVGRGGLLPPLQAGTYEVTPRMLDDLRSGRRGVHASNLGAYLAREAAKLWEVPAYIVDPVSVDEMDEVARVGGLKGIERESLCHALNIRAVAHHFADDHELSFEELRLVVAHLGSGVSMAAIRGGKLVDVINPRDEGPMGLDRPGALPNYGLMEMCFDEGVSRRDMEGLLLGDGGVHSYLETRDLREVVRRRGEADEMAALIFDALVYDTAKWIGAMAAAMRGDLHALVLTGGMAHGDEFVDALSEHIEWIAPVTTYPGEDELEALARGALRVLRGQSPVREYAPELP